MRHWCRAASNSEIRPLQTQCQATQRDAVCASGVHSHVGGDAGARRSGGVAYELGLLVCARWHLRWCDSVRAVSLFH
jgi:hypothetical protein